MDVVLQHDLLRRMIEMHRGQPTPIGQGPGAGPAVDLVMAQQETLQMLPRLGQHPDRRCSRPHQIAHRFMSRVGYPDRGQLAGAVQLGQHQGVPAICLDPVARLHRDQRRRHHDAVVPATGEQTVKPISARTGFVAEAEATATLADPSRHPAQDVGAVLEHSDLPDLPVAAALGHGHANRRLVHVQSDIGDIVH
jgi:hypothetical protein